MNKKAKCGCDKFFVVNYNLHDNTCKLNKQKDNNDINRKKNKIRNF